MARQLWPDDNPIGKRVRDRALLERRSQWVLNAPGRDGWFEVIGVVRDAPNRGLREPIAPAMYYPYTTALSDTAVLLMRTKGNPAAAERDLRMAVNRADDNLPIIRFITPDTFMGWQQEQFVSAVLLGFAGVALLFASFGLLASRAIQLPPARASSAFGSRSARRLAPCCVRRCSRSALRSAPVSASG